VTGYVESLAYGPGGDTLAVGGDGFIRLLDARTYEQLAETLVDGLVTRLIFSRDGSRLVVATAESVSDSISIRDPATLAPIGAPIEPEGYAGAYRAQFWGAPGLALSPDGSSVLTASNERELVWWDLRSRSATRRLTMATLPPSALTEASSWSTREAEPCGHPPAFSPTHRTGWHSALTGGPSCRRASTEL
jgi:WD40 repeat protein